MESVFMKVLEPQIQLKVDEARREAVKQVTSNNLYLYVQDGDMRLDRAASRAGVDQATFIHNMVKAGYRPPRESRA